MRYFKHEITGFACWGELFQKIEVWRPLIEAIYRRHGLPLAQIEHLTPGTNAVFRLGDTVVKILAPREAEISEISEYAAELQAMSEAAAQGVALPDLLCHGTLEDRYTFDYLVLRYIPGRELGETLPRLCPNEQSSCLTQIQTIVAQLQRGKRYSEGLEFIVHRAATNSRWRQYSDVVRAEVQQRLSRYTAPFMQRVHGDMTGENLLLDTSSRVVLIDFADSCIAPPEYEYPALVFELFDLRADFARHFFAFDSVRSWIDMLFPAILLHDFGADYLRKATERLLCCSTHEVESLAQLEAALCTHFSDKQ